jgi:hypothetical protein
MTTFITILIILALLGAVGWVVWNFIDKVDDDFNADFVLPRYNGIWDGIDEEYLARHKKTLNHIDEEIKYDLASYLSEVDSSYDIEMDIDLIWDDEDGIRAELSDWYYLDEDIIALDEIEAVEEDYYVSIKCDEDICDLCNDHILENNDYQSALSNLYREWALEDINPDADDLDDIMVEENKLNIKYQY